MLKLIMCSVAALVLSGIWWPPTALAVVMVDRSVVTQEGGLEHRVAVRNVRLEGSTVVADLVNYTNRSITDVRLLVADSFRWKDEMHPGDDDPSRATILMVPGPIEPNQQITIRAEIPPLPERRDGFFETRVEVVGLVEERPPGNQQTWR